MDNRTDLHRFDYDNPEWARELLLQLRYNIPAGAHEHISKIIKSFINGHLRFPAPVGDDLAPVDVDALREHGFCRLGRLLNDVQLAEIRHYLQDLRLHDQFDASGPGFAKSAAPRNVNTASFGADAIARAPHLAELALHPLVLHRVSRYLGAPPTLPFIEAWWSFHERDRARQAQNFHADFHDFKWLKLFVYLTDVDDSSGPHVLVRGSHDPALGQRLIAEIEASDPNRAGALEAAFAGGQRVGDDDVEALFGADRITPILGRAGEAFLVDTSAYHKGVLPRSEDRLVFQALYTLLPTIKDPVRPVSVPDAYERYRDMAGERAVSRDFWRYCTRLIFTDQPPS